MKIITNVEHKDSKTKKLKEKTRLGLNLFYIDR